MEFEFADCVLDAARHELRRGGAVVHVEPQVFDLLALLVRSDGALVSYDDLITQVWQGRIVSDATMAARISAARAAVGDDGKTQGVIRTVPRRGVQLVVPVRAPDVAQATQAGEAGPAYGPIRMAIGHDGTGLAWSTLGSEGPPLVRAGHWLTHLELDRRSITQHPQTARLGRGRQVVMYDPRGTGLSDRDCPPVTLEDFAKDLLTVVDASGHARVSIFAPSQAASVSCLFAAAHPERVDRMVFYGGFAQGADVRDGGAGAGLAEAAIEMIRQGWGKEGNAFTKAFSTLFYPGASEAELKDFMRRQEASASVDRAVEYRRCLGGIDIVDVLPRVTAPVLVAHARGDCLHPFSQAKLFARHLPNAELLMTDSNNHALLPSEPAFGALMDAIDAFLA